MKNVFRVCAMLLFCTRVNAQVQELDQLKLDIEKLAQFKLILSQMKQGFQVMQNGYNSVRDAAKGNFDLHKNYLDGLLRVTEQVRHSPALQHTLDNQSTLQTEFTQWMNKARPMNLFTFKELTEIQGTYQAIIDEAKVDQDALQIILQPQVMRMSDGERLAAIEQIAARSETQLGTVRQLIKEKTLALAVRARTQRDIEAVKKLYGAK